MVGACVGCVVADLQQTALLGTQDRDPDARSRLSDHQLEHRDPERVDGAVVDRGARCRADPVPAALRRQERCVTAHRAASVDLYAPAACPDGRADRDRARRRGSDPAVALASARSGRGCWRGSNRSRGARRGSSKPKHLAHERRVDHSGSDPPASRMDALVRGPPDAIRRSIAQDAGHGFQHRASNPAYFKWIDEHGTSTYVRFMLTHPRYTFVKPLAFFPGEQASVTRQTGPQYSPLQPNPTPSLLSPQVDYGRHRNVLPSVVDRLLFDQVRSATYPPCSSRRAPWC